MNRKRKRKIKKYLIRALFFIIIFFLSLQIGAKTLRSSAAAAPLRKIETISLAPNVSLYSSNAILVALSDNTVLFDKKSDEKLYPASLTKIMTAIVAIESITSPEEKILLSPSIFEGLYSENASMAGFLPDEEVAAIDLLYGTLLPSGAECSVGLAVHVSGSEKEFVKQMNQKAGELGMVNTHFENVTGLHHKNHYTTVADISVLLSYALENETFKEIFTSADHVTAPTNLQNEGVAFSSTLFKKIDSPYFEDGQILGGKTGYTDEAGLCLASFAEYKGENYILVTAGAPGNSFTEQTNITDAFTVYDELLH